MKAILVMGFFIISNSAFSAVFKSYDTANSCNLYRAGIAEESAAREGEVIVSNKGVYGFSFSDMEIDFENREVSVQVMTNVTLGINTPLLKSRSTLSADQPDFKELVNQLNRKLLLLEKVCISSSNKIVYANRFEEQK